MDPISTNFPFSMMKQHFQKGNKICLESMMAKFRTLFQSHFEEVIAKVVAQPLSARLIIKRSWVQASLGALLSYLLVSSGKQVSRCGAISIRERCLGAQLGANKA